MNTGSQGMEWEMYESGWTFSYMGIDVVRLILSAECERALEFFGRFAVATT